MTFGDLSAGLDSLEQASKRVGEMKAVSRSCDHFKC